MEDFKDFDPCLFGIWMPPGFKSGEIEPVTAPATTPIVLEIKSSSGAFSALEEQRRLLNEMTVEMRDQFMAFRRMRTSAEQALETGDDAAQKLARADVKAATDAMSLIVRTLEKVDALQRQLARDQDARAERAADEGGYEEAKARLLRLIEERANDKAKVLFQRWRRDGSPDDAASGSCPSQDTS